MQKLTDQERLKPWMGVVLFAVGVLFLLFIGSYKQSNWGIPGLVLTEAGFLLISILYCVITKVKIKEVFSVKKISGKDFLGVLIMFAGGFLLNLAAIGTSMFILDLIGRRDAFSEITGLSDFLYGSKSTYIFIMIIVAIIPAICEEAFMRGAVLSNFRSLKKDWMIVVIIGLFFGILHLSPLRFLNTACLGGVLAYIMVKKNNILLPMLLHFLNNFVSSLVGFLNLGQDTDYSSLLENMDVTTIMGSYLVVGFLAPILLVIGAKILNKEGCKPVSFVIGGSISAVMLIVGMCMVLISGGMLGGAMLNWNYSYTVTEETLECDNLSEACICIEEERTVMVVVSATASKADITFTIDDENGEVVYTKTANGMLMVSENLKMSPGNYTLYFTGDENMLNKTFTYQVIVK